MHSRLGPSGAALDDVAVRGQALAIGIGFRRGITIDQIEAAIRTALEPHTMIDIACVATLESKASEPAIIAFCERHRVPLRAFSTQDVQACLSRHPSLSRSTIAYERVGVDGVCEPCALLAAPGGMLVRNKRALDGVTVAIAALNALDRIRQMQGKP